MSATEEENWRRGLPLRDAWLELADHMWPEGERKARWKALIKAESSDTLEETDRKLADADRLELGLKQEIIYELEAGKLQGYGRDITDRLDSPLIKLPPGLFTTSVSGFQVDWDSSYIVAHGRKVIEVRVVPVPAIEEAKPLSKQSKGGRPRKRDILERACEVALSRDPNFCGLQTKAALPIIEDILKTDLKTPKGFVGGVHAETLRRAKKAVCEKR